MSPPRKYATDAVPDFLSLDAPSSHHETVIHPSDAEGAYDQSSRDEPTDDAAAVGDTAASKSTFLSLKKIISSGKP
jgi:hypothetical protein